MPAVSVCPPRPLSLFRSAECFASFPTTALARPGTLERASLLFILLLAPGGRALRGCNVCMVEPGPIQQGGWRAALLMLEGGRPGVVPNDLTVGGGRPLHAPATPIARGADARVTAGGTGPAQHGAAKQVAVEDGSVRGRAHRLAV